MIRQFQKGGPSQPDYSNRKNMNTNDGRQQNQQQPSYDSRHRQPPPQQPQHQHQHQTPLPQQHMYRHRMNNNDGGDNGDRKSVV